MCRLFDINVASIEVFGSAVYWLKCQTHPRWTPGDIDMRFGIEGYAEISTFEKMLEAFHLLSKGAEMELVSWREIKTYNQRGRPLKVRMDILLSHQLPPAESTLTAWSMMRHRNGEWLLNDRAKQLTSTLAEFGGEVFGLNEPNHEVKWLAPLPPFFKDAQYLVGRLAKLYRKVRWVADHPYRVVEIDRECTVCLSEQSKHIVHKCGHTNCLDCTSKLQRPTCPECRKDITQFLAHREALPEFYIRSLKETGVASAPAL
jgi:hypothetical protein